MNTELLLAKFKIKKKNRYQPTDGPTDGLTDGSTDRQELFFAWRRVNEDGPDKKKPRDRVLTLIIKV